MLPFILEDTARAPAAVRGIRSARLHSGFSTAGVVVPQCDRDGASGSWLSSARAAESSRDARRTAAACRSRPQALADQFAGAALRLQIQLPVLSDPGIQPAAASPEIAGANRRGDVAAELRVRP